MRNRAPWVVAAAFSASGVVHLVHPETFTRIVPTFLPAKTALVYVSGVAELICAVGPVEARPLGGAGRRGVARRDLAGQPADGDQRPAG